MPELCSLVLFACCCYFAEICICCTVVVVAVAVVVVVVILQYCQAVQCDKADMLVIQMFVISTQTMQLVMSANLRASSHWFVQFPIMLAEIMCTFLEIL